LKIKELNYFDFFRKGVQRGVFRHRKNGWTGAGLGAVFRAKMLFGRRRTGGDVLLPVSVKFEATTGGMV
jgi:hypothetical protein